MIRRDYLQRQIDQLGKALGKLLTDLTGLKNQGRTGEIVEITNLQLKTQMDLNLDELTSIPAEKFIKTLREQKELKDDHLSSLADIMFVAAEDNPDENKKRELYLRCLEIYDYLDKDSSIYSFERYLRIEQIRKTLQL